MNRRGIIGSFISMFVATVVIVIILGILLIGSGIVKKIVAEKDNFGIQDETATGLDDVFDYMDYQFNNMTYLRAIVKTNGDWEGYLEREMKR